MSRAFLISILLIVSAFCIPGVAYTTQTIDLNNSRTDIRLISRDRGEVVIEVNVGEINVTPINTKAGSFAMVTVDGFTRSHKIGEPALPMLNKILAIPFGCELSSEIVESETEEIFLDDYGITDKVIPAQPSLSKSQDSEAVPFEYNQALYQKAGYYGEPESAVNILGTMRSLHLGTVAIAPFAYDPVNNSLKIQKRLVVRVKFEHPDWALTSEMQRRYYSPMFEPIYSRVINYQPPDPVIMDDLVTYPVKYLIIANRMFESQLQPFIEWKIQKGFMVVAAYTDVIGSTNTAIKSYIQGIYNNSNPPSDPAPSFVLFVGDDQQIPAFSHGGHISDLDFCEYTGDDIPEIYYGRFSAQNTSLLQPQIDKTLEYEKYLMPDPSYLGEVTMIAGVDAGFAPTWGNGQINYGTTYYFNSAHGIYSNTWLYPASDQSGAAAAIIQTVNDGVGYINYTAHGSHDGWYDPSFSSSDISGLTNAHKYPLAVGNCCLTNTFGDDYTTPCAGEVWLQSANKGAIGYIGGSNSTYWDEDYWWGVGAGSVTANPTYEATGQGAYDGVFHDHGEALSDYYVVNDALIFAGNMAVEEAGGSTQYYWQIYHLMGDPSVMTYMGVPAVNSVSHASSILLTATSFAVSAAPGSYVGISMDGVLHGAAYIGQSGSVNVPLTSFGAPGTADIVVTAQNHQPYIQTIQVISPSGPYVLLDSYAINDVSGNNNSEADAGESILLGAQLINVGPDPAYNVTANLSSTDPYVSITDGSESYGTINGDNGTVNRADAFAFSIDTSAPDGHNLSFALEVSGTAIDTWTSNFTIPVHAPDLGFISLIINDASGNSNGILDPGETALLTVTAVNDGSGDAGAIDGTLSESDSYVSISDANGYFGDIPAGGTGNNSGDVFIVSALSSCPQGHQMTFNLDMTTDLGQTATLHFDVIVGDRNVIFFDDFSSNQGWTGLGGNGEWTIGAATGGSGSDSYGGPDPATDHSPSGDNGVLGNDLTSGTGGDYNSSLTSTYWVTSPAIDCSDYTDIIMTYYHWLGIERNNYDTVYFQVYDGSSWTTLFANGSETIDESSWNEEYYDLSSYADENSSFQLRFGIGGTDASWQYCGWNIDDIEIKGYYQGSAEPPDLAYSPSSLTDSLAEGQSSQQNILVENNGTGNLRIRFTSSQTWLQFNTEQQNVAPDGSMDFPVTINATGLNPGNYSGAVNFTCNDPDTPSGTIPVSLYVYPPVIYIAQSSLHETLESGEQSSRPLVISNTGNGVLNFTIDYETNDALTALKLKTIGALTPKAASLQEPIGYYPPVPGKTKDPEPYYPPMILDSGGPDAFGYRWIDSDEAGGPTYSWKDITSAGTPITGLGDDTNVGPFPIGFDFDFYGNTFTTFRFCTNGFISFTSSVTNYTNAQLPSGGEPYNLVAPFWDDMNFNDGGNAYYYSSGDSLIVSYIGVAHYSAGGPYSFQVILLGNNKIIFQYQDINSPDNSCTIGIQNGSGSVASGIVYDQAYVHENLAIQFSAPAQWLDVAPTSGAVAPQSVDTVDVLFDASDLADGDYNGQVSVSSNDSANPQVDIPVTLTVGLDAAMINVVPGSIVDTVVTGGSDDITLVIGNDGNLNLEYTITDNRSWIGESPTGGTIAPAGTDNITVTLDASTLPQGSYSGALTISSNAYNNPTVNIPVSLIVIPPPAEPNIELNFTAIADTVEEGGLATANLEISNTGLGDLHFTITDNRTWLSESPDNGTVVESGMEIVEITLDAATLTLGTYTGTITVSSDDPDEGSVPIDVTLVVEEAGTACDYLPGDINGDGNTIGSDITFAVNFFRGSPNHPPDSCYDDANSRWLYVAGDVNGDCNFIGSDITYYVGYFRGVNTQLNYCPRLEPSEPPVLAVPLKQPDDNYIGKEPPKEIDKKVKIKDNTK